jgi:hypothetical protein
LKLENKLRKKLLEIKRAFEESESELINTTENSLSKANRLNTKHTQANYLSLIKKGTFKKRKKKEKAIEN